MPSQPLAGLRHETIGNRWITRSWCVEDGLATTVFKIRPRQSGPWLDVMLWGRWWPFDAIITVDGLEMPVTRLAPDGDLEGTLPGAFEFAGAERTEEPDTRTIHLRLLAAPGGPLAGRISAALHCRLAADRPLMRTWLTIRNEDSRPHTLDQLAMEMVYPSRAEVEHILTWHGTELGRDQRFLAGLVPRTRTPIRRRLGPGEQIEGFSLLTAACPADSRWRTAARQDLVHQFAPHTRRPRILQQGMGWRDLDDLRRAIDEAGEMGIEVVMLFMEEGWSRGDMTLNRRLFPRGEDDVRELCAHARRRGVTIGFYVGQCIAPGDSRVCREHEDWQFLSNGKRFDPAAVGNMCPSSPWGDHLLKRLERIIQLGVGAIQADAMPGYQLCEEPSHGHAAPQGAMYDNWAWEAAFYRRMRNLGVYVQSASDHSVLFEGADQVPGGYTEDDQSVLEGLDQIAQFRANLQLLSERWPPSCRWGFMLVGRLWERPGMVSDPEGDPVRYEHALASHLGCGFTACLHATHLFNGPRSRAILARWLGFYHRYRDLLCCRTLPLRMPGGSGPDAVLHCSPEANPCAAAVVFNPHPGGRRADLAVPLEFAGWTGQKTVGLRRSGDGPAVELPLDDQGWGVLCADMEARGVDWWEFSWL